MKHLINKTLTRAYWLKQRAGYSLFPDRMIHDVPSLKGSNNSTSGKRIGHVAMYSDGNAGDTLLPRTVRDAIDSETTNQWLGIHAHRVVNKNALKQINALHGLLIGGGGLFLRDSNPNNLSGWQWSCSQKALNEIKVPIALFAVGYNRFRNQPDFKPVFRKHLELLTEKSIYIGLRNSGSIRAIKTYLPTELHDKIRYQPCPTTLTSLFYPELCSYKEKQKPLVAINCAFDRIELRLGKATDQILSDLALGALALSKTCRITYYAHAKSDHQMLPYLKKAGVPFELKNLFHIHPREVVEAYSRPDLVIGMRGHAQMIPFGCQTPILSLVSHDKIQWFLDDIERPEWGIEMIAPNFKNRLIESSLEILEKKEAVQTDIKSIQSDLLHTTQINTNDFISAL